MPVTRIRKAPRSSATKAKAARPRGAVPVMMRNSKVARWGNSLAFRIPQDVADKLRLTEGGQVSVEVQSDSFTIRPVRKKWTEEELLKGVTPDAAGGEINWGGPVGREI
jgi:antitoxin MazE